MLSPTQEPILSLDRAGFEQCKLAELNSFFASLNFKSSFLYCLQFLYFKNYFWPRRGLGCCVQAFSSCGEQELFFLGVCGLLIVVASLVAEHGLHGSVLSRCAHWLGCSVACGIFRNQGLNPFPLLWQVDSELSGPPGSAGKGFLSGHPAKVRDQEIDVF